MAISRRRLRGIPGVSAASVAGGPLETGVPAKGAARSGSIS